MVTPTSAFSAARMDAGTALPLLAADALRKLARDESVKQRVETDPALFGLLKRAADRYIGGTTLSECLETVRRINRAGHAATADYMGESTRTEEKPDVEAAHFLQLAAGAHEAHHDRSASGIGASRKDSSGQGRLR